VTILGLAFAEKPQMNQNSLVTVFVGGLLLAGLSQIAPAQSLLDGAVLYMESCAACHGGDGRGRTMSELAFATPVPDFTDCDFANREPDGDWGAIIHEGGPIRGFDRMMPAFGEALTMDEIDAILLHVRGFCRNPHWPRGDLNLPRALFTEKAYPEDEAVIEGSFDTVGDDSYSFNFLWEQRFGTRNQMEISIPIQRIDLGDDQGWVSGAGDLAVGVKHVLRHSLENGSILSVGGEYILATGDEQRDLGKGSDVFEAYLAYGKMLPNDSFLQLQAIAEFPTKSEFNDELVLRAAVGRTLTFGSPFGRAYTPMFEVQGKYEDGPGSSDTEWNIIPQMQITLNTRQHVMVSAGLNVPVTNRSSRDVELVFYLLWDWFDGGVLEGW
jgi:mono/diheme cytochrome c family protein